MLNNQATLLSVVPEDLKVSPEQAAEDNRRMHEIIVENMAEDVVGFSADYMVMLPEGVETISAEEITPSLLIRDFRSTAIAVYTLNGKNYLQLATGDTLIIGNCVYLPAEQLKA